MSIPYRPAASDKRFQIPSTLKSDFNNFLNNDIPGYVMNFTKIRDWYDEESRQVIRGMIYPDTTKSRYSNTDNNLNFRGSLDDDIIKGDMLIDQQGTTYLLDWQIAPEHNNKASRAVRCNYKATFTRPCELSSDDRGYQVDERGFVIEDNQQAIEQDDVMVKVIAGDIPINAVRYDGRPEFSSTSHTPGVVPNALTIIIVQYNDKTKNIEIDDEFVYGKDIFVIVDIDYVGVNIDNTYGVLRFQCRKKAGGYVE